MKKANYTIREIEDLTEAQAAAMATESEIIKEHQIYFIDFGGYFGYSALVFADGQQIKYANDYELHHKGKSAAELKEFYQKSLSRKLFTADELKTITDYKDRKAKEYYLRNLYALRREHISIFFCGTDENREKRQKKTKSMIYSPLFLAYYNEKDADFVKSGEYLMQCLETATKELNNSREYWKSAFLCEMLNHEYGINWQADFDVCSCFGDCSTVRDYTNARDLFAACNFSEVQRAAYMDAQKEYYKNFDC